MMDLCCLDSCNFEFFLRRQILLTKVHVLNPPFASNHLQKKHENCCMKNTTSAHFRQLRVPHDFLEKFQTLAAKLEECADIAKEEEENTPEVDFFSLHL